MTTRPITVAEVAGWLEAAYPPALAEDWDRVGLGVGDPDAEVTGVLFAVDVTLDVVEEAVERGAQLIVSHHPVLLRGVHAVRADEPKGRLLIRLIREGVAVFTAHTNADAGHAGVADALADAAGLVDRRPMQAASPEDPTLGLGRVGRLPEPLTAHKLAERLADAAPSTAAGIRLGGDPQRTVSTVAVLGGAGDSMLDAARGLGVDCYVTGDLRHHPAQDFLAHSDAPALIDVPHWAAEWLWLPHAEALVRARAAERGTELATHVSTLITDPWQAVFLGGNHDSGTSFFDTIN